MAELGRARVRLVAMSLLYFLLMAGTFNALGVVLPRMVPALGLSWAEAGFGFTLLGLSCGLASLLPAAAIRLAGVRPTLILATALLAGGFGCLAAARDSLLYDVGTVLLGLGFCCGGTVPGVHVISAAYRERASSALGAYFTLGGLGSVAGPLFFAGVDHAAGDWRLFWALCAMAAVLVGLFAAAVTGPRAHETATPAPEAAGWSAREGLRAPQYWVVVTAYSGCLLVNTTLHGFAAQHVGERGLSLAQSAALLSLAALVGAGASALAGWAGERVGARALTAFAGVALAIAAAALAVPQGWATLVLFAVAFGAGLGASYVGTATLLIDWFGRRPNLELYSVMCVVSTVAAAGPVVGGMVRDATGGFAPVFGTLAGVGLALAALTALTPRPVRAREPAVA